MELVDSEFQFRGQCVGGPLDSQEGMSRFIGGFILVDRDGAKCWIYDYDERLSFFKCRDDVGYELDHARRFKAANETAFDVRSVA